MFTLDFNGHTNHDFMVEIKQRPDIPVPKKRVEYIVIPGKDGTLTRTDDTYEDIPIEVEMNYITKYGTDFPDVTRKIKRWLTGSGILKFSDDNLFFHKVKNVEISNPISRVLKRAGFFKALFTCDPYMYYEPGNRFMTVTEASFNPLMPCQPIYKITGEGYTTLTVNGNQAGVNVSGALIIDTSLSIMYRDDGTFQNTLTRINYRDFFGNEGKNTISISNGMRLEVKPNWRTL